MKRAKVGIDVQSTRGRKTGIGVYTENLLAGLRRVARQYECLPISRGRSGDFRTHRRLLWQQVLLPLQARIAGVRLLHIPGFDAPRWAPCPTVLTVHDLIGALFPGNFPPVSRWYWSSWLPKSIRWADRVIASSHSTRRDILRLTGVPGEKIHVVYPGVGEEFRPVEDASRLERTAAKYRLPRKFLLFVGTLEPRKGVDVLLEAFRLLAGETDHHLVLVGRAGWGVEDLPGQLRRADFCARVHWKGFIDPGDLANLYNLAGLLVFPSRYEGFGLPPLEAMACGVPVVCTETSSLPEVVGDAAIRVPVGEAHSLAEGILRALTDRELRERLRTLGLHRARTFSRDDAAGQVAAVYDSLL
ncbi:MAG TPA: glycosyltransferase family 1 protein [Syntrophobacteraceae bacterium]|mgnify:CR=1 FL=1|nr:glycosyltransferase family 1 protein [Syntrophobacteraceae bacterium]